MTGNNNADNNRNPEIGKHKYEDFDRNVKMAEAKEAREDSILIRPKTETYESNQGKDVGSVIKKENYTHTEEERKRDELNRKNRGKSNKPGPTY